MNKDFKINLKEHLKQKEYKTLDPISSYFQKCVGNIIKTAPIALSAKNNIFINSCDIPNTPNKLVFTVGLCTISNVELYLCLPKKWELKQYLSSQFIEETLPIDLLRELTAKIERKNSTFKIEEGLFFDKTKKPWNNISWATQIDGFIAVDQQWMKETEDEVHEESITLYALVPVLHNGKKVNKKRCTELVEEYKSSSWDKICVSYNPKIEIQNQLNEAILNYNLDKVKSAVKKGADINRGFIDKHWQFGYYSQRTILEKAFDSQNEELVRYLINEGAEVPINSMAIIGGWGTKEIYKLLKDNGADINAESINMTALERAKAFNNNQGIKDLLELGAEK